MLITNTYCRQPKTFLNFRKAELEIYEDMDMDSKAKREALNSIDKEITDYAMIFNEVVKTGIKLDKEDAKKSKEVVNNGKRFISDWYIW